MADLASSEASSRRQELAQDLARMSRLHDQLWQGMEPIGGGTSGAAVFPRQSLCTVMVHFGQRLREHMEREWRSDYLEYQHLKQSLRQLQSQDGKTPAVFTSLAKPRSSGSSINVASLLEAQPLLQDKSKGFDALLLEQYDKVDHAFHRHLTDVESQFQLVQQLYHPSASPSAQESVKNTLVELHAMLEHLMNFALLNYSGFIELLHKYERRWPTEYAAHQCQLKAKLQACSFSHPSQCQQLLTRVEQTFADAFCEGDRFVAVSFLTTRKDDAIDWAPMYIGIKIGACLILIAWVVWDTVVVPTLHVSSSSTDSSRVISLALTPAFPVYRGVGGCLLLHWLLGVSMYVWHSTSINYRYILDLNPRTTLHYSDMFSDATNMSLVFLANVLLYHKVVNGSFPERVLARGYYPLLLFGYAVYFYLLRPWRQQRAMLTTVLEVVGSPFFHVSFLHVLIGNYMASTVKVTQDLAWSLCYFGTREFLFTNESDSEADQHRCKDNWYYVNVVVPLICALPLWWRFLQNLRRIYDSGQWWPSLPNAIKYALAHVVALFGLFHPLYQANYQSHSINNTGMDLFQIVWVALLAASSIYMWIWDVWMDWGLGRPHSGFLRSRQMLSQRWYYYAAIVADLFLPFAWLLTLIPPQSSHLLPVYLPPFTMALELFRRSVWSLFALENEHLRNCKSLQRVVGFIPLHFTQQEDDRRAAIKPLRDQAFVIKIVLIFVAAAALSVVAVQVEG